jgi:hypothetical protein
MEDKVVKQMELVEKRFCNYSCCNEAHYEIVWSESFGSPDKDTIAYSCDKRDHILGVSTNMVYSHGKEPSEIRQISTPNILEDQILEETLEKIRVPF